LTAASTRPQCTLRSGKYKAVPIKLDRADVHFSDPLHAVGNLQTKEVYFAVLSTIEPPTTRTVYGKLDKSALPVPLLQDWLLVQHNNGERPGMIGLKGTNPGYHPMLHEHHQNKEAIFGERLLSNHANQWPS
tara:strand:- start:1358 stop:1753 length:396 start_codon:yes stop_codon:yes gene_type:complete